MTRYKCPIKGTPRCEKDFHSEDEIMVHIKFEHRHEDWSNWLLQLCEVKEQ